MYNTFLDVHYITLLEIFIIDDWGCLFFGTRIDTVWFSHRPPPINRVQCEFLHVLCRDRRAPNTTSIRTANMDTSSDHWAHYLWVSPGHNMINKKYVSIIAPDIDEMDRSIEIRALLLQYVIGAIKEVYFCIPRALRLQGPCIGYCSLIDPQVS